MSIIIHPTLSHNPKVEHSPSQVCNSLLFITLKRYVIHFLHWLPVSLILPNNQQAFGQYFLSAAVKQAMFTHQHCSAASLLRRTMFIVHTTATNLRSINPSSSPTLRKSIFSDLLTPDICRSLPNFTDIQLQTPTTWFEYHNLPAAQPEIQRRAHPHPHIKMCDHNQTLGPNTHDHLSHSDPTSTIREVQSGSLDTTTSPLPEYATFECSACKAQHSKDQGSPSPPAPTSTPESESSDHDADSEYSGCSLCYYSSSEIDSDMEADILAWCLMVRSWELDNHSTQSRYSDRLSVDSQIPREESVMDEEHGYSYRYGDYNETDQLQMVYAVQGLILGTFMLMLVTVVFAVFKVFGAVSF
ncbi:hypothetical protein DL98DRAFT_606138 [Cadophora sp. DSE1049]|nr:hypothetical protein DL98DRAFT_606138 [Cadophora sp. DSE1049]